MSKQVYMYLTGIVAAVLLWGYFVYVPFHENKISYFKERGSLETQLHDFQTTIAQLPAYLERKKALNQERKELTSKLYTKEEVLNLFGKIRQEANSYHLEVVEITPPVEELLELNRSLPDSTQPQFLTIGVRLAGDYIQFGRYVRDIEEAPYFRGLRRCTITGNREKNEHQQLYVSFKALLGNFRSKG